MAPRIPIDREKVAAFCRRHHIQRLSLFGSVLREDFGPESDVDVLVDFEPGVRIGLVGLAGLELELSSLLGRKADLRTREDLSRHFRDFVVSEAVAQYGPAR